MYKIDQNNACKSCYFTDKANGESSPQEYLLDSGATTHVMMTDKNAIDIEDSTGYVLVGNGEKCSSTKLAKYVFEENETGHWIE